MVEMGVGDEVALGEAAGLKVEPNVGAMVMGMVADS